MESAIAFCFVILSSLSLFPRSIPCHYEPPNVGRERMT
jgi:hypothetical protein